MKKTLIYTLTVATIFNFCSCSEQLVDAPQPDTGKAISFANVTTKADLGDFQADGFGVWTLINNSMVQDYVLMDNQYVEYKDGEWEYTPLRYWVPETNFNFIATFPYDADGTYYTYDTSNSAVKLTVAETPSEKEFLIATNETDTSDQNFDDSRPVNLEFKHVLTGVELKIWRDGAKHQNDQMRIKQVTLSNIRKSGNYSSNTGTWTQGNDKLTVQKVYEDLSDDDNIGAAYEDNGGITTGGIPANPFNVMKLIPQTLDASNLVSLDIQYQLKRNNAAEWEDAELEAFLPGGTWEPNKYYTYNVVLSSVKNITIYYIQTQVDPWGTPQVGGTVIIK